MGKARKQCSDISDTCTGAPHSRYVAVQRPIRYPAGYRIGRIALIYPAGLSGRIMELSKSLNIIVTYTLTWPEAQRPESLIGQVLNCS